MKNIEEMIADAKAEEEIQKTCKKFVPIAKNMVSVELEELVDLRQTRLDFGRLMVAISESIELGYTKNDLRIYNGERIIESIKIMFPQYYADIWERVQKSDCEKGE